MGGIREGACNKNRGAIDLPRQPGTCASPIMSGVASLAQ